MYVYKAAHGILRIGKVYPLPGEPNCQVDTGGAHCVRADHEAAVLGQVRARRARDAAARESAVLVG